jgi:hypothetical protein
MMESSFAIKDRPNDSKQDTLNLEHASLLPKHYKQVFENIWEAIEKVISEFRNELFETLKIISNPVEVQEKTMG